jgi:dipeptidyl aminopeptidase/acylaminoacyl peptidase
VLSELSGLTWSRDASRIFVGIKEQLPEVEDDDDRANVEIWHWSDDRLQSVQKVRGNADERFTYSAVVHVPDGRFVRLADEDMPRVEPTRDGRIALGRLDSPYRMELEEQGNLQDIVRIDVANGQRTTLLERVRYSLNVSPDGRWHVYSRDGTLFLQDIASGESKDLSALAGVSFASDETGRPGETTTWGVAGWSRDGRYVMVNAKYDVWMLPVSGTGRAIDLTGGVGARDDIRFRIQQIGPANDDEPGIDTSKPIMLSAYGEWTKKSGYWTVEPGRDPQPIIWEDRSIGQLRKADDADRVIFTSQTFEEFPDWYVSDTRFSNPRKVTDANPHQSEYAWGRRVLIDYTDERGNDLQATLALPAGYQEGQRYPMLVYFYERLSQNHHSYSFPTYDDRPHMSTYASNGYLVLMPDIVYDVGKPGSSALDDVTSAVRKVIELGYADPERIGAQGHSWGGYESSFIVTQTDMFAAVVTGAPLTNLESMHNILYKQSGGGNAPLIQWGQGRMGTVPWRDPEGYASQSPVRFVDDITTPFLILHGTSDGAVDWNQGLEFYVAARRAGKQVILLSYPDEPHHLSQKNNQIDFQIRMKQYFDHYLKGEPAPPWMTDGVPFLDRPREQRGGG